MEETTKMELTMHQIHAIHFLQTFKRVMSEVKFKEEEEAEKKKGCPHCGKSQCIIKSR